MLRILVVCICVVALTSCQDTPPGTTPTESSAPAQSNSPSPSAADSPAADPTGPAFVNGPSQGEGGQLGSTLVIRVRTSPHTGFDRMVVDLDGPVPSWQADYATSFVQDGSGEPVPIKGKAGLQLSIQAQGYDENIKVVYVGKQIDRPRLHTLRAWAVTGDFEGTFGIGIALNSLAPYRVFSLTNPTRLVIDVRH